MKNNFKGNVHVARRIFLKRFFSILMIIGTVGSAIYLMFFSQIFKLQKWEVVEGEITFVNHYLDEYLKPLEGQNIILIDTEDIKTQIQSAHPNFSEVIIKKVFPATLVVTINEFPLVANVINYVGEENIEQKFIINSVGIAVEKDEINPDLPYIRMHTPKTYNLLDEIIPPDQLNYISQAVKQFEETFGMKITEIHYRIIERELHLLTEKGFFIWLDSGKNNAEQLMKLKKALPKLDLYQTPLEYIDLRISGAEYDKVIYKKK